MSSFSKVALIIFGAIVALPTPACLHAQATGDPRNPGQPTFPTVCSTHYASLTMTGSGNTAEPSSETSFDTSRIQSALNSCASGQAVELASSGGTQTAFLLQPIYIPTGVTLQIDAGVTVFASRNPADYQTPGSGAAATSTLTGTAVNTVSVTSGGSLYVTAPQVSFYAAAGSGATATANLATTGGVANIYLSATNGGTGCPNGTDTVTFTGGGYTTIATATASVVGGVVQGFTITSPGAGYTSAPTVSISGCTTQPNSSAQLGYAIASVTVNTGGTGYTTAPIVGFGNQCGGEQPVNTNPGGCRQLITTGSNFYGSPTTSSAIIGYGIIDGRGRDTLVDSSGNPLTKPPYWSLIDSQCVDYAWVCLTINAYDPYPSSTGRYTQNIPIMVNAGAASSFTVFLTTIYDAPYFNVRWHGNSSGAATVGFTAWGVKIIDQAQIPNTDGIDPVDNMNSVTIADTFISNGDDNIAIDADQASYSVSEITIKNLQTYAGDGLSIGTGTNGSISNILADNVFQNGNPFALTSSVPYARGQSGIKLKSGPSKGGTVSDVLYENFCIKNQPTDININGNIGGSGSLSPAFGTSSSPITFQNIDIDTNADGTTGKFELYSFVPSPNPAGTYTSYLEFNNLNFNFTPTIVSPYDTYMTLIGDGDTPTSIESISGTNMHTYTSGTLSPANPSYCSVYAYPQFAGQMFLSTASPTGSNTNLQTMTIAHGSTVAFNAVLEPTTYESPAPTAQMDFFYWLNGIVNGTKVYLGTESHTENGVFYTVQNNNLAAGTYTIYAEYPANGQTDSNYRYYEWGPVTLTVTP